MAISLETWYLSRLMFSFHRTLSRVATVLMALTLATPAWAGCREQDNPPLEIDTAEVGVDSAAPGPPVSVEVVEIVRGMRDGCNSATGDSCLEYGYVKIHVVSASDDRTPTEALGYSLRIVSGSFPAQVPEGAVTLLGEHIYLEWYDDQGPLSATLSIQAVDLAGNIGPALSFEIESPGTADGCRFTPPQHSAWFLLVMGLGLFGRRRSRGGSRRAATSTR